MLLPPLSTTTPLLLLLLLTSSTQAKTQTRSSAKDAIHPSKIQSLTLRANRLTSHRRVPAIPQLRCVGGSGCPHYTIDVLRCTNSGFGYTDADVEWTCTASLPPEVKLGSTDVICEGYANADDPFVLKGSCGVEYRLVLTDAGIKKFGEGKPRGVFGGSTEEYVDEQGSSKAGPFFWLIFVAVALFILWSVLPTRLGGRGGRGGGDDAPGGGPGGGGGGGWWGGGPGTDDDPPPPYDWPGQRKPDPSQASSSRGGSSGPGFWTGLAAGAAGGYLASQRNRSNQRAGTRYDTDRGEGSWRSYAGRDDRGGNDGGWGGGGSSSVSSSRYESTGFGSTSRR